MVLVMASSQLHGLDSQCNAMLDEYVHAYARVPPAVKLGASTDCLVCPSVLPLDSISFEIS